MKLAVFLAAGDSFTDMSKRGQDAQYKRFYLSRLSKNFEKVFVFSYLNESVSGLPKNVILVPNKWHIHRYLYGIILPFLNFQEIKKIDVVRAYHLSGVLPAIVTKIFFGKKFVFNYAYDYFLFSKIEKKYFQLLLFAVMKPLALLFSSKIFAANKIIYKEMPSRKKYYLPNGVDVSFFKPTKKNTQKHTPIILSVGRLEAQKNFENVILALEGLQVNLRLVGSGTLTSKLKKLAKERGVNLEILSKVANIKMPEVYHQSDIFVIASFAEGSPKALLEAMSCGLPVVVSKEVDKNYEIVNGRCAFICKNTSKELRLAIRTLLANAKLRSNLGKSAAEVIRTKYSLTSLLKQEIAIIKSLST